MELKDKNICVTGASGFLGKHLVEALRRRGAKIIPIDFIGDPVEVLLADISDWDDHYISYFAEADIVYHLAAVANPRMCIKDFRTAYQVNVGGTLNVLEHSTKAQRIIFSSTAAVYGSPEYLPVLETHPTKATDPYAITKMMGELLVKKFRDDIPYTIMRNCNIFGPRQSTDYLIPTLIWQGLTMGRIEIWDKKPVRDFIYVDDAIEAMIRLAECDAAGNEIVNIASGRGITTGDLASIIATGLGVPWVEARKPVNVTDKAICDTGKILALTGWTPKISLERGIIKTIEYYRRLRHVPTG